MRISHLFSRIALAFVMVSMVGSLASCTVTPAGPSKSELITRSAGWKFDSFSVGTPTPGQTVAYTGMKLVFASSGSVIFTPAATAVAAGLAPTLPGTWDIPELSATTLRFGSNLKFR